MSERPKSHAETGHPGNHLYELVELRHHVIVDHGQLPSGVEHVSPNLLVTMHDSGAYGEHRREQAVPATERAFAEHAAKKGSEVEELRAEIVELRTGMEMMAMGMRALENALQSHVRAGPHHAHPES